MNNNKFWGSNWTKSSEYEKIMKKNKETQDAYNSRYNYGNWKNSQIGGLNNNVGFSSSNLNNYMSPNDHSFLQSLQFDKLSNINNNPSKYNTSSDNINSFMSSYRSTIPLINNNPNYFQLPIQVTRSTNFNHSP